MNKKITKIVSALLLSTMVLTTGCGSTASKSGSANSAGGKYTVNFWTISLKPTFTKLFDSMIAEYQKENPNITVKWTDLPYESIEEKLVTSIAGGTAPDVVNLNTMMALNLGGKGALVDLNKEATQKQRSIYIDSLYNSTKIDNSAYAFPWYASPDICIYNKALFQKAGISVPTQFEAAFEDAKTMKEKTGAYLFNPPEFYYMMFEDGFPILNADNSAAAFNNQNTLNLLQGYKNLTDKGYLPKTNWGVWDNELKLFETGKLAVINSSGSSLSRIKDEAPDIYKNIGIAQTITGTTGTSRDPLMDVVVPTASKNHAEAIKFANFITNDANQLAFCKAVAIFPSTKEAAKDPFFTANTTTLEGQASAMQSKVVSTSADFTVNSKHAQDVETEFNKIYEASITGNKDIKSAISATEKSVNSILSQK